MDEKAMFKANRAGQDLPAPAIGPDPWGRGGQTLFLSCLLVESAADPSAWETRGTARHPWETREHGRPANDSVPTRTDFAHNELH